MLATLVALGLVFLMDLGLMARGKPAAPVAEAGDHGGPVCGAVAASGSGVLTSPNYPHNYTNNINCTYIITASYSSSIELVFSAIDLENGYDFLILSSGAQLIGRFTGSTKPPTLTLGNVVTLRFTTDHSVVKSGFSVRFTTLEANCGNLVFGWGLVSSPGYPRTYFANQRCVWGLVATMGHTLTLDFQSFDMQVYRDWLELYDGNLLVARYTGSTLPPRANLGTFGRMVFTTDSSIQSFGFQLAVNSAALRCGGLISGYATITSPNYPSNYPANASCTWTYRATANAVSTKLVFTAFNLEMSYDFVKVYDGATLRSSNNGAVRPPQVELRSQIITVTFTSDFSIQSSGFRLQFLPVVII